MYAIFVLDKKRRGGSSLLPKTPNARRLLHQTPTGNTVCTNEGNILNLLSSTSMVIHKSVLDQHKLHGKNDDKKSIKGVHTQSRVDRMENPNDPKLLEEKHLHGTKVRFKGSDKNDEIIGNQN